MYVFTFLFLLVAVCEIWFRIEPEPPGPGRNFKAITIPRLAQYWLNRDNANPLLPPFKFFSNTDFRNQERLHLIASQMSLPRNKVLESYDFLRPAEFREKTSYTATINNLGFRGPQRTVQKPENVFRIIALGSYHTFGHAVNDEDTYPSQLEQRLNSQKTDTVYEVWNYGNQEGSAIVGLAKLQMEILDYKPDLIIWDYGYIDPVIMGDNQFLGGFFFPESGIYRPLMWFLHLAGNVIVRKSMIYDKFRDYLVTRIMKKNIAAFADVTMQMLKTAEEKQIPVIILRQSVIHSISPAFYRKLADSYKLASFIDGEKIFERYPPSHEMTVDFYAGLNWLSEFDPSLGKDKTWYPPEYFIDIFQYNKWGHKAIATYLSDEIAVIKERMLSKNL
ncbi:MAG: hypothetical protein PHW04_14815 [Candidatus Wallbacteria bacterium]|nr:hypothetical protein [Candidatus Wallbacteria bacterium]